MILDALSGEELDRIFRLKFESGGQLGVTPSTYKRFGYHSPEDYYEGLVDRLVGPDTVWMDVGCGRALFPSNPRLAQQLADRCKSLIGVDPDPTIQENPVIHEAVQESVYEFRTDRKFDLVTLRMVAEHIDDPARLMETLRQCTADDATVIIYTVNAWSPVPLLTRITPLAVRHPLKRFLWRTEEKDTFPTSYRMNSRRQLRSLFSAAGFDETFFSYLDDCRTLSRFRSLLTVELAIWRMLRAVSLRYPEMCLLGAYQKRASVAS